MTAGEGDFLATLMVDNILGTGMASYSKFHVAK